MADLLFLNPRGSCSGTRGHVDGLIADAAASRHGVLTTEDLLGLGLSRAAVQNRSARGSLHRLYPDVYAVGDPLLSLHGRWLAAVRACGPDAALSHRDAAMLWGLIRSTRRSIDVIGPGQKGRKLEGIDRHIAALLPRDLCVRDGIPCTSPSRTLLDFAAVAAPRPLERAFEEGWTLGVLDLRSLEDVLERAGGHHGAGRLKRLVERHQHGSTVTESGLEELFLALVEGAGVECPQLNVHLPIPGEELKVDCLWSANRLVVELDSRRYHSGPLAFTEDRRRDRLLRLAGYDSVRFTDEELVRRPDEVVATVVDLLQRSR